MEELNLPIRGEWFIQGDLTQAGGYEVANHLLNLSDPPSAILCCNDLMAFGAMSAAQDQGLTVGKEISITGFDDIPMAEHSHPPLTTLKQPVYQIGSRVCEMLIRTLRAEKLEEQQVILKPELIVRHSSGQAPK